MVRGLSSARSQPAAVLARIAEMVDCEPSPNGCWDDLLEAIEEMVEDNAAQAESAASRQAYLTEQQERMAEMRARHAAEMAAMQARVDQAVAALHESFERQIDSLSTMVAQREEIAALKTEVKTAAQASRPSFARANQVRRERADAHAVEIDGLMASLIAEHGPLTARQLAARLDAIRPPARAARWSPSMVYRIRGRMRHIRARLEESHVEEAQPIAA